MYGNADVTICDLWVQYPRSTQIDFAYPVILAGISLLVPRPELVLYKWTSIFDGLSSYTWLLLGIVFISFWTILKGLRLKFGKSNRKKQSQTGAIFTELFRLLITSDGATQFDIPGYPVFQQMWSIFSTFMILIYSCNIITSLTVPRYDGRVDKPADFVKANLTWGITHLLDFNIILDMNDEYERKMREQFMIIENRTKVAQKMLDAKKFAILLNYYYDGTASITAGNKYGLTFSPSQYRLMKEDLYAAYISYGFQFNSPYKESMELMMVYMFEAGFIMYYKRRVIERDHPQDWDSIFNDDTSHSDSEPKVLRMGHVFSAFVMLIIGQLLAFTVLIWELRYKVWLTINRGCFKTRYKP